MKLSIKNKIKLFSLLKINHLLLNKNRLINKISIKSYSIIMLILTKFSFIWKIFKLFFKFISLINLIFIIAISCLNSELNILLVTFNIIVDYYKYIFDQIFELYHNILKFIHNWIETKLPDLNKSNENINKSIDVIKTSNDNLNQVDSSMNSNKKPIVNVETYPQDIEDESDPFRKDYKNTKIDDKVKTNYKPYIFLCLCIAIGSAIYIYNPDFYSNIKDYVINKFNSTNDNLSEASSTVGSGSTGTPSSGTNSTGSSGSGSSSGSSTATINQENAGYVTDQLNKYFKEE